MSVPRLETGSGATVTPAQDIDELKAGKDVPWLFLGAIGLLEASGALSRSWTGARMEVNGSETGAGRKSGCCVAWGVEPLPNRSGWERRKSSKGSYADDVPSKLPVELNKYRNRTEKRSAYLMGRCPGSSTRNSY